MRHAGDGRTSCRGCKGAMRLVATRALLVSIVIAVCDQAEFNVYEMEEASLYSAH
jgi:hypothetical protein